MIDDDEFNTFVIDSLRRALEHGGEAFNRAMEKDDTLLQQSFDRCSIVFALWPDAKAKCGFAMMPVKREAPPDPRNVVGDVMPCPTREAALALQERFGHPSLKDEFQHFEVDGAIPFLSRLN
ncbi:hypothetical protein [Nitrobacter sp. JJSN]|jgi:hypothetical protein|uniref:hypothetical protein n=1 Tax=Nitrobacter sp. JJSN TaxID=3453033 RepID=UPI003F770B46